MGKFDGLFDEPKSKFSELFDEQPTQEQVDAAVAADRAVDRAGASHPSVPAAAQAAGPDHSYKAEGVKVANNALEALKARLRPIGRGFAALEDARRHPIATATDPTKRRQLLRGVDDMVTLGHGQRLAGAVGRALGDTPDVDLQATEASDAEAAPDHRTGGSILAAPLPGAVSAIAKVPGVIAGQAIARSPALAAAAAAVAPRSAPLAALAGATKSVAGYEATMPLTAALSAGAEGRRLDAAKEAATDPLGLALSGVIGAGAGVAGSAPERISARIQQDIGRGETVATKRQRMKLAERAGEDGERLDDMLARDRGLEHTLAVHARNNPGKAAERVEAKMAEIRAKSDPEYRRIDQALATHRRAAAEDQAAGLLARADDAQAAAAKVRDPGRDLRAEARRIDAPPVDDSLFAAARRIDAPTKGRPEPASSGAAERAAAGRDATKNERKAAGLRREAGKLERGAKADKGGIDLVEVDDRLATLAERLRGEGHPAMADAVERVRDNHARNYGTDGRITPGTIVSARAVRNMTNDIGDVAFPGAVGTNNLRTRVHQEIYGTMVGTIHDAAQRAGVDVTKLRQLDRDMSVLIPMRDALKTRAADAATGGRSLGSTVADAAGAMVGGVVGGAPGAVAGALSRKALVAATASTARRVDYRLSQLTRAARSGATPGQLQQFAVELGFPKLVAADVVGDVTRRATRFADDRFQDAADLGDALAER